MPEEIGRGKLALDRRFRRLLKRVLPRGRRPWVAEALTARSGRTVTKRQVDEWCAESKSTRFFPAYLVRLLCDILGDRRLQGFFAGREFTNLARLGERNKRLLGRFRHDGHKPRSPR